MPERSVEERINSSAEVQLGYTQETACEEAGRCLRCHLGEPAGEAGQGVAG